MKKGIVCITVLICMSLTFPAFAGETIWDMAKSEEYGKKSVGMLGRGFVNVATCFVDLIVHTVRETEQGPPLVGTLTGLGSGIGCTALRVSSGALDVVTFWVPGFNGFPVSRSYEDCTACDKDKSYAADYKEEAAETAVVGEDTVVATTKDASRYLKGEEPAKKHDPMKYVKK